MTSPNFAYASDLDRTPLSYLETKSFISYAPIRSLSNLGTYNYSITSADSLYTSNSSSFISSNSWITPNNSNGLHLLFRPITNGNNSSLQIAYIPYASETGVDLSYFSSIELRQLKSDMSTYQSYSLSDLDAHFQPASQGFYLIMYNFPTNKPNYNGGTSNGIWIYDLWVQNSKYVIYSGTNASSSSSGLTSGSAGMYEIDYRYLSYPIYHIWDILSHHLNNPVDDAILDAKLESEPVIDEMLEDFTGDGSASTKVSDVVSAKDTSGALKSGLATGGSTSDTFSVFDITSDFFKFFSQDCYDYVNGIRDLPITDYRSRSLQDTYPDFTTSIDSEYWERINND